MKGNKCQFYPYRQVVLTPFPLLDLERQVQGSDGEVHGLRVHAPDLTQQVQDQASFAPHQTRQQLRDPATSTHKNNSELNKKLLFSSGARTKENG